MKQFNAIIKFTDKGLDTQTAITGGVSTAAFLSGIGLSVGITLSRSSLPFFSGNSYNSKMFLNIYCKVIKTRCN